VCEENYYNKEYHKKRHINLIVNDEYFWARAEASKRLYFQKEEINKRIMEFGCGIGQTIAMIPNARGWDVSSEARAICRKRKIMVYENDRRLRLYTNDQWVDRSQEVLHDEQLPAIWEDGFTLSSILRIKEDCPNGHIIEFTASYETNTWNPVERNLHWGKVLITVRNNK
jgi:hypothetical protein